MRIEAFLGYLSAAKEQGHLRDCDVDLMVAFYEALIAGISQMARQKIFGRALNQQIAKKIDNLTMDSTYLCDC